MPGRYNQRLDHPCHCRLQSIGSPGAHLAALFARPPIPCAPVNQNMMRFSFDATTRDSGQSADKHAKHLRPWRCTMMKRAESHASMPQCRGGWHLPFPDVAALSRSGSCQGAACASTDAVAPAPDTASASTASLQPCDPATRGTNVGSDVSSRHVDAQPHSLLSTDAAMLTMHFGCSCADVTQTHTGARHVPPILTGVLWSEVGRTVNLLDHLEVRCTSCYALQGSHSQSIAILTLH
jgi:hypothetical protein